MLNRLRQLLELVRFSHTIFALPFALLAALLAWQPPAQFQWRQLAGILLCMTFARSAATEHNVGAMGEHNTDVGTIFLMSVRHASI